MKIFYRLLYFIWAIIGAVLVVVDIFIWILIGKATMPEYYFKLLERIEEKVQDNTVSEK